MPKTADDEEDDEEPYMFSHDDGVDSQDDDDDDYYLRYESYDAEIVGYIVNSDTTQICVSADCRNPEMSLYLQSE